MSLLVEIVGVCAGVVVLAVIAGVCAVSGQCARGELTMSATDEADALLTHTQDKR